MIIREMYYQLKPFIPVFLQLYLRRKWVLAKRSRNSGIWPIDESAGKCPKRWVGWPEGKRFAIVLTHDVESSKGVRNSIPLAELEMEFGFRSSFNFVAQDYQISQKIFSYLRENGFEIGLHGLSHDGNLFRSKPHFDSKIDRINHYLREWRCDGFRSPSMYHNLSWICDLDVEYDASTFDTDPFEPQPDGVGTIFPFWVPAAGGTATSSAISVIPGSTSPEAQPVTCNLQPATVSQRGFIELPYTLPQDHTLFILMGEKDTAIWKKKLAWIVERGGMALVIVHPDYMNFGTTRRTSWEYPASHIADFLEFVRDKYEGQYWHALPKDVAHFWKRNFQIEEV